MKKFIYTIFRGVYTLYTLYLAFLTSGIKTALPQKRQKKKKEPLLRFYVDTTIST